MVATEATRPIKKLVFLPHEAGMPSSAPLTRQEVIKDGIVTSPRKTTAG